ncbi:MAG TPA: adenylate/guanylate cyclase domain-containing protein [Dongiaceae bacterium]|nr:adenylate/guanylate cyclase domain-containing protein [Dongiaceae bacterium]
MKGAVNLRRIRLGSGLVLFGYVTSHYLNHALGLISLSAMDEGSHVFLAIWRNPLGTILLYGSVLVHFLLALWALFQRRSFRRLGRGDWAQILLGFVVPPLIFIHVVGTRGVNAWFGTNDSYEYVLLVIWVFYPMEGVIQIAALAAAWLHGCIGLRGWLRLKPWYGRAQPYLFAAALLIPILAFLGFVEAGREVDYLYREPGWFAGAQARIHFATQAQAASLYAARRGFLVGYALLVILVLAARQLRDYLRRLNAVMVTYADGEIVELHRGSTILDASRQAGIPHASVCGGRGRCSTCRVRILAGLEQLPPPDLNEIRVLQRVGAPPNVRLACQTRPTHPVQVVPLLAAGSTRDSQARAGYLQGREQEIAILFADLRAFTRLAHQRLPYDTVFLLNRYFRAMGMAVDAAGGHLDKFIGDGVMALFGIGGGREDACRRALAAARRMSLNLQELNRSMAPELREPLRIGIGIHAGPAIVGEMGYDRATTLTAIGDTVNTASRLEALTKEYEVELVFSAIVAGHAGLSLAGLDLHQVTLRGQDHPTAIVTVESAATLPESSGSVAA